MKKRKRDINKIILFYLVFLLTVAWILLVTSLLVVWLRQPVCPDAMLGPPQFPAFLFYYIGGFIAFSFSGLYMAYRVAFAH